MRNCKLLCLLFTALLCVDPIFAGTLEEVKKRGFLQCGVSQRLPGFAFPDDSGNWSGLDVDICRAIATAIFKDSTKVRFIPLSTVDRFTALQSGEIDVLSRNTTWNFTRDSSLGIAFTGVTFYDGQGFLVPVKSKITDLEQLSGATICTNAGTTSEMNLADYFRAHDMTYKIVTFQKDDEVIAAYGAGRCDAYTSDRSGLAAQRLKLAHPEQHEILPIVISKEPLGPAVRQDDFKWFDLVRWVVFNLINAEEAGINQATLDDMRKSTDPTVMRILGESEGLGKFIGLSSNFMYHVIEQVGNYGEIFDRNVGKHSKINLPRGLNNLWTNGGIMYGPPFS
jgi:general L-amino acid transport system substrate-binding protein